MRLLRAAMVELQVVHALVLRETRTRFGTYQLGYLWALLEPVFWIGTFVAIFHVMQRGAPTGMTIPGFLCTGLFPFTLFRECTYRVGASIDANKGLLFYPQIKPLDLVFARLLLEVATSVTAFSVIMGADAFVEERFEVEHILWVMGGFGLAAALGGALGLILCSISVYTKSIDRVMNACLRPMFWFSGIYFAANDMPTDVREVLLYNPLLHITELTRGGWYHSYDPQFADAFYPLKWILVLTFLGLTLERVARRKVQLS